MTQLYRPQCDAKVPSEQGTVRAVVAKHAGARRLAANLYELEQGTAVSRLHFHHANEELLFVLAGNPTLRRATGNERTLDPGEVIAFLAGPSGAHQVLTNDVPEVAEQVEERRLAIITAEGLRVQPLSEPLAAR